MQSTRPQKAWGPASLRLALPLAVLVAVAAVEASLRRPERVLIVTVTKGYRHESIPNLERLITAMAAESGAFEVDFARSGSDLDEKASAAARERLSGIVFASTSGDLPLPDRDAFPTWIEAGHAFIGIHAATDTFPGFPAYLDMVGGQFDRHGPQTKVEIQVRDTTHPATRGLGKSFEVFDEIYQFKRLDPSQIHVLLGLNAHPETGAAGSFPLAWTRQPGRGHVFYTALGHRPDVVDAPWFRRHLLGGILWALRRT